MVNELGNLVREYPLEDAEKHDAAKLFVRGLTVREYIDLGMQGVVRGSVSMFVAIAMTGIIGWENVEVLSPIGEKTTEFKREYLEDFPEDVLVRVGKFIYMELTEITEDIAKKLQGHIRFLYWASDDKHRFHVENFDCNTCLKKGLARNKKCGKFSNEEIDEWHKRLNGLDEPAEEEEKKSVKDIIKSRYKSKKSRTTAKPKKKERKVDKVRLADCNFEYPECPISWIDEWIKDLGSVLYHCEKSNIPFFAGGVGDQPYFFYKAAKVVIGEANSIEREEHEKQMEDINK